MENTCKQIGALKTKKKKSKIVQFLKEYNREYKRMHGLHYREYRKVV